MLDINAVLNTCYIKKEIITLAFYSHLIPVFFSMSLAFLVFAKAGRSLLSKIFLSFILVFSIWLIGDLITWTSNDYYLVYTTWSFLAYIEIIFYVLGLYFAILFIRQTALSFYTKVLLFIITLPPLFITLIKQSVGGFNYPVCEAFNNNFLDIYKLIIEVVILVVILIYLIIPFIKKVSWRINRANLVVLGSMFLFLSVFGVTEYIASITGYYELNLYSLFILPIFLFALIYSVFDLNIFHVQVLGTYYLVAGFLVLTSVQIFFVQGSVNKLLTLITLISAVGLSFILFRNLKRESDQRVRIEKLSIELEDTNVNLENLVKQRESLVHLVTHKVKGSFTHSKYIFAGILEGMFGEVNDEIKKRATQGLESDNAGIQTVDLVLNAANLQKGNVKFDMKDFDFKDLVLKTIDDKKGAIEAKGLKLETNISDGSYNTLGDVFWLKEVVHNLLENSIRYTKEGKIMVGLENKPASTQGGDSKILFSVKDTGVGITDEDKKNLFTEGGRGKDSVKVNVDSTGYGLYSVKIIMDAHKGRVLGESEGPGKGSQFFVEFNAE